MPDFKAYIFDLDGTLLDTLEDIADCMNRVLTKFGYAPKPVDKYRYFVGEGMEMLVRNSLELTTANESTISAMLQEMKSLYNLGWKTHTGPYDGIIQTLNKLSESGFSLNVLSNKPHEFTMEMVKYYFPSIPFQCIYGSRPGYPANPLLPQHLILFRNWVACLLNVFLQVIPK